MTYTDADHRKALQAARNGTADKYQQAKLTEAAKQAGARGREAAQALQGKKK